MGVYIKDMEMPKDGAYWCELGVIVGKIATITIHGEDRKSFSLIPVPSHGNLIDANKLAELCDIMADKCGNDASIWHQFKTAVEWSPVVIPAEEEGK